MSRFAGGRRATVILTVGALTTAVLGLTAAGPAQAADCSGDTGQATVQSITVAPLFIRGAKTNISIPVTVAVCDPAGLVKSGAAVLGVKLDDPSGMLGDYQSDPAAPVGAGDVKSYSFTMTSYYADKLYGLLDVGAAIFDGPEETAEVIDAKLVHTTLKSRTYATNTPSATTVKRGGTTVVRGVLRRFDGAPLANQRVAIRVVPAGWTRGSFAGYARTTSTGAFALTVRAYYTGSWYVNYAGDATAMPTYKAAWVRVIG